MNWGETIEKSKALDRLLRFDDTQPEHSRMPLQSLNLSDLVADVGKAMNDAKAKIRAELQGMVEDIQSNADASIKKVRAHRAETNAAFGDILGNEMAHPVEDAENPTNGTGGKGQT